LGRRRQSRFLLEQPLEGSVQIREEAAVEQWHDNEMVVLSPEPCRPQEQLRPEPPGTSRRSVKSAARKIISEHAKGKGHARGKTPAPAPLESWASETGLQSVGRAPPAQSDRGS
jgi:hypothetical protein